MSYLLAVLALIAFGLGAPACAIALVVWLFGDGWNWRHALLLAPVVLMCINAPAYAAAVTGLMSWKSAFEMHLIAIVLFGLATVVNNGNAVEGYALAMVILTLSTSVILLKRAWREDPDHTVSMSLYSELDVSMCLGAG